MYNHCAGRESQCQCRTALEASWNWDLRWTATYSRLCRQNGKLKTPVCSLRPSGRACRRVPGRANQTGRVKAPAADGRLFVLDFFPSRRPAIFTILGSHTRVTALAAICVHGRIPVVWPRIQQRAGRRHCPRCCKWPEPSSFLSHGFLCWWARMERRLVRP